MFPGNKTYQPLSLMDYAQMGQQQFPGGFSPPQTPMPERWPIPTGPSPNPFGGSGSLGLAGGFGGPGPMPQPGTMEWYVWMLNQPEGGDGGQGHVGGMTGGPAGPGPDVGGHPSGMW